VIARGSRRVVLWPVSPAEHGQAIAVATPVLGLVIWFSRRRMHAVLKRYVAREVYCHLRDSA
jgi:hypothetical protein